MPVIEGNFNVADLVKELETPPTQTAKQFTATSPLQNPRTYSLMKIVPPTETTETRVAEVKWWMKPFYLYVVWPVCGAVLGVLISMLMNLAYHQFFAHAK